LFGAQLRRSHLESNSSEHRGQARAKAAQLETQLGLAA
jgi:hypothetical protein